MAVQRNFVLGRQTQWRNAYIATKQIKNADKRTIDKN